MRNILASATLLSLLMPLAASADTLSACRKNFPKVKTLAPVTKVMEDGNDYLVVAHGTRFKARFKEDNFASFLTAIGGGKITLYADATGNLYGPYIAGTDSLVSAKQRACIRF